jgi:hypothetical protein
VNCMEICHATNPTNASPASRQAASRHRAGRLGRGASASRAGQTGGGGMEARGRVMVFV